MLVKRSRETSALDFQCVTPRRWPAAPAKPRERVVRLSTTPVVLAMVVLAAAADVSAWGATAHQAIAEAAQSRIGPRTRAALVRILQARDDLRPGALAAVAAWPDEIRRRQGDGSVPEAWSAAEVREADRFNREHPTNGLWHFVNLPLGASGYPPEGLAARKLRAFVSPDDIVHALRASIAILESPTPPADFSQRQAVSWLVHLVGDVHQPMHVTAGYYDTTSPSFETEPVRIDDPQRAARSGVFSDRGGNGLVFAPPLSPADPKNLHAAWDSCLPAVVSGSRCNATGPPYAELARRLEERLASPAMAGAKTGGDHHLWPAAWASDSLRLAVLSGAYDVRLGAGRIDTGSGRAIQAIVTAPSADAYARSRAAAAADQLAKAAIRLAELLDAIEWQ